MRRVLAVAVTMIAGSVLLSCDARQPTAVQPSSPVAVGSEPLRPSPVRRCHLRWAMRLPGLQTAYQLPWCPIQTRPVTTTNRKKRRVGGFLLRNGRPCKAKAASRSNRIRGTIRLECSQIRRKFGSKAVPTRMPMTLRSSSPKRVAATGADRDAHGRRR